MAIKEESGRHAVTYSLITARGLGAVFAQRGLSGVDSSREGESV
jgi:hypothetical protein